MFAGCFVIVLIVTKLCNGDSVIPGISKMHSGPVEKKFTGFSFHIPGYRYCGPGTDVEKMDDSGGPVNVLDEACRQHDVDYMTGIPPQEADEKFLIVVQKVRPDLAPALLASIKTKILFETWFGKQYTSSLYFYAKTFQPSLIFYFAQNSNTDRKFENRRKKNLERNKWTLILEGLWQGYCYPNPLPSEKLKTEESNIVDRVGTALDTPMDGNGKNGENQSPASEITLNSKTLRIGQSSPEKTPTTPDYQTQKDLSTEISDYPPSPYSSGCRIVINEVALKNSENDHSFIEHTRVCPRGAEQPKSVSLTGLIEVVLEAGDPINQVLVANFNGKRLRRVLERRIAASGPREVSRLYFVIGSESVTSDMKFKDAETVPEFSNGLPMAEEKTYCIVLLKVHHSSKSCPLSLNQEEESHTLTPLSGEGMNFIERNVQDVFIVGAPCSENNCGFFFNLIKNRESVIEDGSRHLPIPDVTRENQIKPYLGLSRCSSNSLPMQMSSFQVAVPTPQAHNNCIKPPFKHPFSFMGQPLQSTAQKIIINAKSFLDVYEQDNSLLRGSTVEKTAAILGISTLTVYQTLQNHQTNLIVTPGQKRIYPTPVLAQFDQFRIEHLNNVIQGFYQQNLAPTLDMVYKKLIQDVREEENGRVSRGENVDVFKCSKWSLRKMIRKLGFRFKTVNKRAVILLRMDIVARRWKYLTIMKQNRESPNPKCVIYTDETWIDPFARTGKGWVVNKPKTFEEEALYSFKFPKVGRGPRVIILHAGGKDGFVPNVMKVYSVSKSKVAEDYNQNVDGVSYMEWWRSLNAQVKENYGPCIIVIDNASYYSTSEAPKSNWKKQELYDWLADNIPLSRRSQLKPISEMRRPELWNMVKQLKGSNNYYLVDKEAEKYGNQVVRLPPYNCDLNPIEYVWKDIKHAVRCSNFAGTAEFARSEAEKIMKTYPKQKWERHIQHVLRLEEKYWTEGGFYERLMDQLDTIPENQRILITEEDTDDEMEDELLDLDNTDPDIIDPLRWEVHDDYGDKSISLFSNIPEERSAEPEPVIATRRRLNLNNC